MAEPLLWEALDAPPPGTQIIRTWEESAWREQPWAALAADGRRRAASLRALGVGRGTTVACVLTNSSGVCASLAGAWFAGAAVASLPVPPRAMEPQEYGRQLTTLCDRAGAELLLVEEKFAAALGALVAGPRVVTYESLAGAASLDPEPPGPDDIAFVQFSSGSTGVPRGCALTARAITAQVDMISGHLDIRCDRDNGVSWLPLSHDMGLFGVLLSAWTRSGELTLSTPERFLVKPGSWLADIAERRATITVGPSFGIGLVLRAAAKQGIPSGVHIPMRTWIVGSDRIDYDALRTAIDLLGPIGIGEGVFTPAYGLAEATLAVTMSPLGDPIEVMEVDQPGLFSGDLRPPVSPERAATLVGCGKPVAGTSVRIEGDGELGQICVRSPSLASGYVGEPEASAVTFVDGELRTSDLGLMVGDELYVVGRMDDVLSVRGRNVHASEIEMVIARQEGVRRGGAVLVDLMDGGTTRLVAMVEPEDSVRDYAGLAREIGRVVANACSARVDECVFMPRRTLPKTPSGKIQRFRCRELLASGNADALARVES